MNKKKILLIATGGTIASGHGEEGLTPLMDPQSLLRKIPVVWDFCTPDALQLLNLDSTNMEPSHWSKIVATIQEEYDAYDGFVIAHGTDTMAYTAAALSYMIQNSRKPIVITGSQKPIDLDITDAKTNLTDSFLYACDNDSQGVVIVFDGKVIAGTRAKKVRSKSYNAFSSIDFPFLALIQEKNILRYIPMIPYQGETIFYKKVNPSVFLLKLIPGMEPLLLEKIFELYDGIIIESFGVGGIPSSISEEFYRIREAHPDKPVIISTQVTHEGSDMTVYEVGQRIKRECRFIESYDMTPEAVIAKTMWMLAEASDQLFEDLFYQPVNYDLMYGKDRRPGIYGAGSDAVSKTTVK